MENTATYLIYYDAPRGQDAWHHEALAADLGYIHLYAEATSLPPAPAEVP